MTDTFLENKNCQISLYKAYFRILAKICDACGIDQNCVIPSQLGMSAVFSEVTGDLKALRMRRGFNHGFSPGKIAGSLVFRLYKTQVFYVTPEISEILAVQTLSLNVAVAFGLELVGTNFAVWPEFLIRELKYFLAKRHSNQESLGICFDIFANSIPRLKSS